MLNNLAAGVQVRDFEAAHVAQLGQFILGRTTWELFEAAQYPTWRSFVEAVEDRFGLSVEEMQAAFYNLVPVGGETPPNFILRVEDTRARVNVDDKTTFHCFYPRLP